MSLWSRHLDEFDLKEPPLSSDYINGYRDGAKGVRFTIAELQTVPTQSLVMRCLDDGTNHVLTLRKLQGVYTLEIEQDVAT